MDARIRTKPNILFQLVAVLLCLTLISIYLVSGLYASYTTKEASGNNAAVASFSPLASFKEDTWVFDHTASGTAYSYEYEIRLSNPSEVDVSYALKITFPDTLLSGAVFTFEGESLVCTGSAPLVFKNTYDPVLSPDTYTPLSAGDVTGTTKILNMTIDDECYQNIMSAETGANASPAAYFDAVITFTQID